jgi:hypothetical protein
MARNYKRDIKPILDQYFNLSHPYNVNGDSISFDNATLRRPIGPYPAGLRLVMLTVYNRGPPPPRPPDWPRYLPWEPRQNRLEFIGAISGPGGSIYADFTPYLPL